jgi:hypothetical protein
MCHFKTIDEHDRLESIVALIHAAGHINNQPIDFYRLHDDFILTDEPEDEVADANEEVGLAFGYGLRDGGHGGTGVEGEVEWDDIEEFLDSLWPNDTSMSDGEVAETNQIAGEDDATDNDKEGEDLDLDDGVRGRPVTTDTSVLRTADNASAQQTAPPTFSFVVREPSEAPLHVRAATQEQ